MLHISVSMPVSIPPTRILVQLATRGTVIYARVQIIPQTFASGLLEADENSFFSVKIGTYYFIK